jgi:hypothetical protein
MDYASLFGDHPFQEKPHDQRLLEHLIADDRVKKLFNLDEA